MRHARVVGNHIKKLAAPLQRADDLCALPFQDANHRAGLLCEPVRTQPLCPDVAPHQHAIFVQRRAGSLLRNHDFLQGRIVRLQKAFSLAIDANPARNEVRLPRLDVTIPLRAGDPAGLFQPAQHRLQFLLSLRRQPEMPEQFRHIGRRIIPPAQ